MPPGRFHVEISGHVQELNDLGVDPNHTGEIICIILLGISKQKLSEVLLTPQLENTATVGRHLTLHSSSE